MTDGPYVEAKEIIASFGVIQADDYDAAVAIARACPPGHTSRVGGHPVTVVETGSGARHPVQADSSPSFMSFRCVMVFIFRSVNVHSPTSFTS